MTAVMEIALRKKAFLPSLYVLAVACVAITAQAGEFLAPVKCELGKECFVQQYPDMALGPDVLDPFCGKATYNEHQGVDFRVKSLKDIERDIPVVAVASGRVLRLRDGETDRLITDQVSLDAIKGKECGNALVIEHADGLQTQLCHLKQGSITVKIGDWVEAGQQVGAVGASGYTQFPHTHITVRKNGVIIDPISIHPLSKGCIGHEARQSDTMFTDEVSQHLTGESEILEFGLTGVPVKHDKLVVEGAPDVLTINDSMTIGWAWFINLRAGDVIGLEIIQPDGSILGPIKSDPVKSSKASFSYFFGKRQPPVSGIYSVNVQIIRKGQAIVEKTKKIIPPG